MYIRHGSLGFATGVALLVAAVLATANAHAQPRREPRENRFAQQSAQQLTPAAQISATECPDRTASTQSARDARAAFIAHNYVEAEALWDIAIRQCGLPDRYEGRGLTRQMRQGQTTDDRERQTLVEAAMADYREAVNRRTFVAGFDTSTIETSLRDLEAIHGQLELRLHPNIVAPHPVALACGGANFQTSNANCGTCGHACAAGQICTAGACRAVVTPPVVTPTTPSGAIPITMIVSGGALAVAGGLLLWQGLEAQSAANADEATRASRGCNARPVSPLCPNYNPGDTTPASVAAWAVPTGAVLLGAGALDAAIGVVWFARTGHSTERPRLTGWYAPGGGGLSLEAAF